LAHAREQTESDFGFVGIVLNGELLRLLATEGFHWHETINREFYESMMSSFREQGYLDFLETHNLIGRAIIHREVVLINSPKHRPQIWLSSSWPSRATQLPGNACRQEWGCHRNGLANRKNGYSTAG
jgi:hypothetical protein